MVSNNASRPAAARMGPEPMAKNLSQATSHPAYCAAMQAGTGASVRTITAGPPNRGSTTNETSPNPAMAISAIRRPASRPPAVWIPKSITRVPPTRVTATRNSLA